MTAAQRGFHRATKEINGQRIEKDMHPAGVHELKRQQLPDVTVFQAGQAQRKVVPFDFRTLRGVGRQQLHDEDRGVDDQQCHRE